jgi:DNA polymerase-3 subunit epsilon
LVGPLEQKLAGLAAAQRYEQAGVVRDRITTVVRACARMQRLAALQSVRELVAARPDGSGGWELSVVRAGRLAAAGHAARGVPPWPVVQSLRATADVVDEQHAALAEESECILRWLEEPGTRLVTATHPWAMPAFGAGGLRGYLATQRGADPFADRRRLRVTSRPARNKLTA